MAGLWLAFCAVGIEGTTWDEWIAEYLAFLGAAGRRSSTVGLRAGQLGFVARGLGVAPGQVDSGALIRWCAGQLWAPETRHSYRTALRGFFGWAQQSGRLAADPAAGLPAIRIPPAVPRPTSNGVWKPAAEFAAPRVGLMLRLAAHAGLRRAEIAGLHTADVSVGEGGPWLSVIGKGGRGRVVPISDELAAELLACGPGWVFPARGGGHLTPQWVGELCAAALPAGSTLHGLRHRFATKAYAGSRDLRAVQILLGHSSVATTQRYVAVCDQDLRRAAMLAAQ